MPNLLLERTEVEELIDFDIDQFIPEGDLPEICTQQGIDASAKKSPGRPKGSKTARTKVLARKHADTIDSLASRKGKKRATSKKQATASRIKANRETAASSGFAAFSQGKKQKKSAGQKSARTKAAGKALAKRAAKAANPGGTKKPPKATKKPVSAGGKKRGRPKGSKDSKPRGSKTKKGASKKPKTTKTNKAKAKK